MTEFQEIWTQQCEAAEDIRDRFGPEKALGYLIGEKLVSFVQASDTRPEFAAELPAFVAEVRRLFGAETIEAYLGRIRRVGPFAHIGSEEEIAEMRAGGRRQLRSCCTLAIVAGQAGGMFGEEDPVKDAEDILMVERIKELLLR